MREPFKRDASESIPYVTINGERRYIIPSPNFKRIRYPVKHIAVLVAPICKTVH